MRWNIFRRSEPDDLAARTRRTVHDERLSDYLDGDLPAQHERALEEELQRDTDLREMLAGMALVRDGMNELGLRRAPRSFTITASRRPRASGLPRLELGMRIATAAASVALVAAFIGPSLLEDSSSDGITSVQPVTVESRASKEGTGSGTAGTAGDGAVATGTVEMFAAAEAPPAGTPTQPSGTGGVGGGLETAPQNGAAAALDTPPAASPESAAASAAEATPAGATVADAGTAVTAAAVPATPAADARSAAPAAASPVEASPLDAAAATPGGDLAQTALAATDDAASADAAGGLDAVDWYRIGAGAALAVLGLGSLALRWRRGRSYRSFGM